MLWEIILLVSICILMVFMVVHYLNDEIDKANFCLLGIIINMIVYYK